MKSLYLTPLLFIVVACTSASPQQFYRPAGAEKQLEISGRFHQLSFEHQVSINDQIVITGKLAYDYSEGSFEGMYEGMKVTSDCHWKRKRDLYCLVSVNGEKAANLSF
jgi:hypothetical protein